MLIHFGSKLQAQAVWRLREVPVSERRANVCVFASRLFSARSVHVSSRIAWVSIVDM
jgi:hypothetical protein